MVLLGRSAGTRLELSGDTKPREMMFSGESLDRIAAIDCLTNLMEGFSAAWDSALKADIHVNAWGIDTSTFRQNLYEEQNKDV